MKTKLIVIGLVAYAMSAMPAFADMGTTGTGKMSGTTTQTTTGTTTGTSDTQNTAGDPAAPMNTASGTGDTTNTGTNQATGTTTSKN
jgi:hypothetical protein